ncbi:uncharacterized protein [Physcomitrium patens]|uniref:uncharacterized protein isoform X2 n=1 Tax=Physcomitrium patens TaxID=3218 RepID=UPI003CCDE749
METTASTSKTLINPLSETKQMLMDPSTRLDHLLPPQKAKLFLNADLSDVDAAWSKLTKTAPNDRTAKFPQWKPSMFDDVDQREYHDYFPMLMEMNSTEFRCVACRCVMSEVEGGECPTHQLPQLAHHLKDWYAAPAMNYLPPQVTNLIAGAGGLWLCEGGNQPRAAIEHSQDVPYADAWEPGMFEKDQTLMCVTNPLTKEYCYLPPFAYRLEQISAFLRMVDWDDTIPRPRGRERMPRGTRRAPTSPEQSSETLIPSTPTPSGSPSGDREAHNPFAERKENDGIGKKPGSARTGRARSLCSWGRLPRSPNCTGGPNVSPVWTWNPRDSNHSSPCIRCHTELCATRFKHPREFSGSFSPAATWPCSAGCTTGHAPATSEPPLTQLQRGQRKDKWSVMRNAMPVLIHPDYAAPGSPKHVPRLSNQDFKDDETVILMDLNGHEIGFGHVWKRKPGDMMDWKTLKSHETAVVITRSIIDVDLEWEQAGYFGQRMKKKKIIGSKDAGKNNMMCSLPIRWPSSLLLRPFETNIAMKCQIRIDHFEGRDDPSFGSPPIAQMLREMHDPIKHPERRLRHPINNMCHQKC